MHEWLKNISIINGLFLILIVVIFVLFVVHSRELSEWQARLEQQEMARHGQMSASKKEMRALYKMNRRRGKKRGCAK